MVSSVFVMLVTDNGESGWSRTSETGEVGKSCCGGDVALRIGEEGIFCMEIKIRHVSTSSELKAIAGGTGEPGTPGSYKSAKLILLRAFLLGDSSLLLHPPVRYTRIRPT